MFAIPKEPSTPNDSHGKVNRDTNKDRRRKHIELDTDALKRMSAHVRALEKAMIDYYGSSVYKLKKDQPN